MICDTFYLSYIGDVASLCQSLSFISRITSVNLFFIDPFFLVICRFTATNAIFLVLYYWDEKEDVRKKCATSAPHPCTTQWLKNTKNVASEFSNMNSFWIKKCHKSCSRSTWTRNHDICQNETFALIFKHCTGQTFVFFPFCNCSTMNKRNVVKMFEYCPSF